MRKVFIRTKGWKRKFREKSTNSPFLSLAERERREKLEKSEKEKPKDPEKEKKKSKKEKKDKDRDKSKKDKKKEKKEKKKMKEKERNKPDEPQLFAPITPVAVDYVVFQNKMLRQLFQKVYGRYYDYSSFWQTYFHLGYLWFGYFVMLELF